MSPSDSLSTSVIRVAALLGIAVSSYALYVESRLHEDNFTAMCDFNENASCSAVLGSKYGHILSFIGLVPSHHVLDIPNAALGFIFYILAFAHTLFPATLLLALSTGALAFSAFLAYVLMFILKDFCLICVASYVLNTAIFAGSARNFLKATAKKERVESKKRLEKGSSSSSSTKMD